MTLFFASVITAAAPIVLRLLAWFPQNGAPALLPVLTAFAIVGGVFSTGGYILVTSMIADIVEEQQVRTGRRSEGLLFAADGFLTKIVSGFATVLPGVLLAIVGFPAQATPASLDPAVMRNLALLYLPITAGLSSLSIWCWRYLASTPRATPATSRRSPRPPPGTKSESGGQATIRRFAGAATGAAIVAPPRGGTRLRSRGTAKRWNLHSFARPLRLFAARRAARGPFIARSEAFAISPAHKREHGSGGGAWRPCQSQ